jgi:hypothetical protein
LSKKVTKKGHCHRLHPDDELFPGLPSVLL